MIFGAAGGAIALLALLASGYLYAHHARSIPPPLWTAADLSEAPPDEDNGWALLRARGLRFAAIDHGEDRLLDADGPPVVPFETTARALAEELARDEVARRALSAKGRFADACLPDEQECYELAAHGLFRQRGLAMLVGARLDDWDQVEAEATALSRQASDYAATCRSIVSCTIAAKGIETLMIAAEAVGTTALAGESPSTEALRGLVDLLRDTPTPSPDVSRTIVSEYVLYAPILAESAAEPLVDLADTMRRMNEAYVAIHAFAADPTLAPPRAQSAYGHPLWWVYNARGKIILDMFIGSLDISTGFITRYRDILVDIDDRRAMALSALERAVARAEARANRADEPATTVE